jgi:hypothetical protein
MPEKEDEKICIIRMDINDGITEGEHKDLLSTVFLYDSGYINHTRLGRHCFNITLNLYLQKLLGKNENYLICNGLINLKVIGYWNTKTKIGYEHYEINDNFKNISFKSDTLCDMYQNIGIDCFERSIFYDRNNRIILCLIENCDDTLVISKVTFSACCYLKHNNVTIPENKYFTEYYKGFNILGIIIDDNIENKSDIKYINLKEKSDKSLLFMKIKELCTEVDCVWIHIYNDKNTELKILCVMIVY